MSSEDNFTTNAFKGITKGIISVTKEEIKNLAYRIINRDLLFIGKKETIEKIKKERKSEEWALFDKYIKDKKLRIIVQIGLTLRDLENNPEERKRLQGILMERYGGWGIHIAHFVQTGFLKNYIGSIISKYISQEALKEDLECTLRNVEKYVVFIKSSDDVEKIVEILKNRIEVNLPKVLIMYSLKTAVDVAKEIKEKLKKEIENYKLDEMTLGDDRYICFFLRDDNFFREEMGYLS